MGESRVTPFTIVAFLFGRADAIRAVAASRGALGLGAALVAAAALAREYDRRDLTAEGWHLALPFVVSVALSFVQFLLFWLHRDSTSNVSFVRAYRAFLACFWMTAPLALLYAIPYERFLDEYSAVHANLNTLTVVSLWRGLVMCRVLQVLAGVSFLHALFVSLLLADVVVLVALSVLPVPVFHVMAGLAQTPAVRATAERAFLTRIGGVFALIVLVPVGLVMLAANRTTWRLPATSPRVSIVTWALPAIVIVGLASLLPFTQPALRLAHRADSLMTSDRVDDALRLLADHPRDAFPPGWRPLPMLGLPRPQPELIDVATRAAERLPLDAWPRGYFVEQTARAYLQYEFARSQSQADFLQGWPRVERFLASLTDEERASAISEYGRDLESLRQSFAEEQPKPATTRSVTP